MRRNTILASVALSLAATSCGNPSSSGSRAQASVAVDSPFSADALARKKAERTKELKGAILAFAKVATSRAVADESTIAASRSYMNRLISELGEVAPATPFAEKVAKTVGVWREVWSDERNPLPPGFKILRPDVFQVVRPDGVGFNIGVRSTPGGVGTAFIKLTATIDEAKERTDVLFVKTFFKPGDLSGESSIAALVDGILDGSRADVQALPETPFPRGPVGAKGSLETVYIDEEIRISRGPNAFSGLTDTFVLVRLEDGNAAAR